MKPLQLIAKLSETHFKNNNQEITKGIFRLILAISRDEAAPFWSNDPTILFLKKSFNQTHAIWRYLHISQHTCYSQHIEDGLYYAFKINEKTLVISKRDRAKVSGNESLDIKLDCQTDAEMIMTHVYRNAHNKTTWGYDFKPFRGSFGTNQGFNHPNILDVLISCVSWLTKLPKEHPEVIPTARKIKVTMCLQDKSVVASHGR